HYDLSSFPTRRSSDLGQFIGGWKVNAIGTFISGRPFTVFAGPNISGTGDPNAPDRPSLNRSFTGPVILGTPEHYFDPRAFSMPRSEEHTSELQSRFDF